MVGIDEVGRGSIAGPLLVVAAKANGVLPNGVTDSKLLKKWQRLEFFRELTDLCEWGEGWVSPDEIDKIGLANGLRLGVERSLSSLKVSSTEEIIIDGPVNYIEKSYINSKCLISADLLVPIVSAASILAKVMRDNLMIGLKNSYPGWGFERHVGYCTTSHVAALRKFGSIDGIHRKSFRPLLLEQAG